jgi:uroporphyrinogen III methyltransferase / synthase
VTTKSKKGAKALGSVVFVGTGPGDPSLITVRAVEVLTDADAVVVDHGVDRAVLAHAPVDAEIIDDTGGEAGQPMAQAARIKLIVAAAKAGRQVVHLLHGDPSTYDDLVEEAAACAKAGIRFEIVPGVPVMTAVRCTQVCR